MPLLLSIDMGLRNLAACVLAVNDKRNVAVEDTSVIVAFMTCKASTLGSCALTW